MSNFARRLALSASLIALGACATVPPPAPVAPPAIVEAATPAPAAVEKSAHDRLFDLFKASDEANLQRNPLSALFRGELKLTRNSTAIIPSPS